MLAILLVVRQDDANGSKHHLAPLTEGDRKAIAKEFGRTRTRSFRYLIAVPMRIIEREVR